MTHEDFKHQCGRDFAEVCQIVAVTHGERHPDTVAEVQRLMRERGWDVHYTPGGTARVRLMPRN